MLTLCDYNGLKEKEVKGILVTDFEIKKEDLKGCRIVVAYCSVGSWGCDSSAFIIFKKDNKFYEVNGSHCSCYGFEGQWQPEEINDLNEVIKRDNWALAGGGHDDLREQNSKKIREYLTKVRNKRPKG